MGEQKLDSDEVTYILDKYARALPGRVPTEEQLRVLEKILKDPVDESILDILEQPVDESIFRDMLGKARTSQLVSWIAVETCYADGKRVKREITNADALNFYTEYASFFDGGGRGRYIGKIKIVHTEQYLKHMGIIDNTPFTDNMEQTGELAKYAPLKQLSA